MSVELLTIELGLGPQPFLLDYKRYESLATRCMMKELWARMHRFGFRLEVHNMPMLPPQERDEWLMISLEKIGYTHPRDREILNTMRLHQQVVYDSDVFAADGATLDPKYLSIRRRKERWSDWRFGKQRVNSSHLCLWREALRQLALNGRQHRSLVKFEHTGHKRWDWGFCPSDDVIYHIDYASHQMSSICTPAKAEAGKRYISSPAQPALQPAR